MNKELNETIDSDILYKLRKELARTKKQIEAGKAIGHNVTKLKNRAKRYRRSIENLERNNEAIKRLKPRTYYTIKIAHSRENVTHTAIMYTGFDIEEYPVTIFNNGYEVPCQEYSIGSIYYFDIIRELEEMRKVY